MSVLFRGATAWALAMAALVGSAPAQPSEEPPAKVVVDAARVERVESLREVTGELRAVRRSRIAAEESGRVLEMRYEEGEEVPAGGVVARLEDATLLLERERAAAEVDVRASVVAEREADLEKAKRDLARLEELQARSAASENEVLDARTATSVASARLRAAEAEHRVARASLALVEERLSEMTVTAPFAGRIVSKHSEVGQWVNEGEAVVELVMLDEIEAWLDVPERFVNRLSKSGSKVQVRITALGETVTGEVSQVVPAADPLSRIFPVRARLKNADHQMLPGMSATGLAPTGVDVDALTVLKDAILRDEGGAYLYYNEGGRATAARVEELFPVGDRVAIRSRQVEAGTSVVVEGNERLYPGQPLDPQPRPDEGRALAEDGARSGEEG